MVLALPLAWLLGKRKPAAVDLVVLPLPVPLILAKLGCLLNGCCYGQPCSMPWAITFPDQASAPDGVPVHPTQVYEMLVLACILVAFRILRGVRWRGTMVLWFLVRWVLHLVLRQLKTRAEFRENPLHIQELHRLLSQMDRLLARKSLVREPGETLMQFSRRIQNQEISHWYQTYANSRFMPENESLQEQISQLRSQLQEIRSRKASV